MQWDEAHSLVVKKLRAVGPMSTIQLAEECKLHRQTVYKHLRALKKEGKARSTGRGWIWEQEDTITPSEMKDLVEIRLLRQACEKGELMYAFNRPDFFKPEWKIVAGLRESRSYTKEEISRGRELGCIYVNISPKHDDNLSYQRLIWPILEEQRDLFLNKSPYFLKETITRFLKSSRLGEIGIAIEYFTGQKDIRNLSHKKVEEMIKSVWKRISIFQVIYSMNIDSLTSWLATEPGKEALATVVSDTSIRSLANRIESLWRIGDRLVQRLR